MINKDTNLGFLFNKEYYRHNGLKEFVFKDKDKDTYSEGYFKEQHRRIKEVSFEKYYTEDKQKDLKTIYPGLAIGLGYGHGVKAVGEFKLGFYFDYTTGLPIIPGSSVKGTLRACFLNKKGLKVDKKISVEELEGKQDFLVYLFNKAGIELEKAQKLDFHALEAEIFDGMGKDKKSMSIYKRDIFMDAEIVKGNDAGKKIIGDDSITPHGDNPLKNPKPLLFMKILPNVTFRFEMDLKDSIVEPLVTKGVKYKVFREILATMGIGAKTNVGYGRMK